MKKTFLILFILFSFKAFSQNYWVQRGNEIALKNNQWYLDPSLVSGVSITTIDSLIILRLQESIDSVIAADFSTAAFMDSSRIVTLDKSQTITGAKTFSTPLDTASSNSIASISALSPIVATRFNTKDYQLSLSKTIKIDTIYLSGKSLYIYNQTGNAAYIQLQSGGNGTAYGGITIGDSLLTHYVNMIQSATGSRKYATEFHVHSVLSGLDLMPLWFDTSDAYINTNGIQMSGWLIDFSRTYGYEYKDSSGGIRRIVIVDINQDGDISSELTQAMIYANEGTEIILPTGRYKLHSGIGISQNSISIVGNGTIIYETDTSTTYPMSIGFTATSKKYIHISGIRFIGTNATGQGGILFRNTKYSSIDNCSFDSLYSGINLMNTNEISMNADSGSSYNIVRGCTFRNNTNKTPTGYAIEMFGGASYNIFANNVIRDGYAGVSIDDATTTTTVPARSHDNLIMGNNLTGLTYKGISVEGSYCNSIIGNHIDSSLTGIILNNAQSGNGADSNVVRDNQVLHCTTGLNITGSSFNSMSNNYTLACPTGMVMTKITYGVSDSTARYNIVKNNSFYGSSTALSLQNTGVKYTQVYFNDFKNNVVNISDAGLGTIQTFNSRGDSVWNLTGKLVLLTNSLDTNYSNSIASISALSPIVATRFNTKDYQLSFSPASGTSYDTNRIDYLDKPQTITGAKTIDTLNAKAGVLVSDNVLYVTQNAHSNSNQYPTIAAAISAYTYGKIILLAPETFNENVTILPADSGMSIIGLSREKSVIGGIVLDSAKDFTLSTLSLDSTLQIHCNTMYDSTTRKVNTFRGIDLYGSIYVGDADSAEVYGCYFDNCFIKGTGKTLLLNVYGGGTNRLIFSDCITQNYSHSDYRKPYTFYNYQGYNVFSSCTFLDFYGITLDGSKGGSEIEVDNGDGFFIGLGGLKCINNTVNYTVFAVDNSSTFGCTGTEIDSTWTFSNLTEFDVMRSRFGMPNIVFNGKNSRIEFISQIPYQSTSTITGSALQYLHITNSIFHCDAPSGLGVNSGNHWKAFIDD